MSGNNEVTQRLHTGAPGNEERLEGASLPPEAMSSRVGWGEGREVARSKPAH